MMIIISRYSAPKSQNKIVLIYVMFSIIYIIFVSSPG